MKRILMTTAAAAIIAAKCVVPAAAAAPQACIPEKNICIDQTCKLPEWLCRVTGWNCDWSGTPDCGTSCPETPDAPDQTPDTPDTNPGDTPTETPSEKPSQGETGTATTLERRVVELVNEQRAAYGLSALTLSEQLCDGARLKSQDMKTSGYFSHESPTYGTPFAMMQQLGISYRTAGENIAMGYSTAEAVVNAWMNSEGHRANILNGTYTQIGVGEVDGYWTQWFIS
jgi:uncharacterized YkwD family protein